MKRFQASLALIDTARKLQQDLCESEEEKAEQSGSSYRSREAARGRAVGKQFVYRAQEIGSSLLEGKEPNDKSLAILSALLP